MQGNLGPLDFNTGNFTSPFSILGICSCYFIYGVLYFPLFYEVLCKLYVYFLERIWRMSDYLSQYPLFGGDYDRVIPVEGQVMTVSLILKSCLAFYFGEFPLCIKWRSGIWLLMIMLLILQLFYVYTICWN